MLLAIAMAIAIAVAGRGESEAESLDGVGFFCTEYEVAVLAHSDLAEGDAVAAHEVVVRQLRGHLVVIVAGRRLRLGLVVAVRLEGTLRRRAGQEGQKGGVKGGWRIG